MFSSLACTSKLGHTSCPFSKQRRPSVVFASDEEMSNRCFAVGREGGKEVRTSVEGGIRFPTLVAATCEMRSATERKDRAPQHENFEDVSARQRASVECLQTCSRGGASPEHWQFEMVNTLQVEWPAVLLFIHPEPFGWRRSIVPPLVFVAFGRSGSSPAIRRVFSACRCTVARSCHTGSSSGSLTSRWKSFGCREWELEGSEPVFVSRLFTCKVP